jgi:hypothetical protein
MAESKVATDDAESLPWVRLMAPRVPARFPKLYKWLERRASSLAFTLNAWGTTEEDHALEYACDAYFDPPMYCYYRGIEVLAPTDIVWRWLCQLRVGTYGALELIDNFGRRSPRELTPGVDELAPGQRVSTMFKLVEFERDESLSMRSAWPFTLFFDDVGLTYRVVPSGANRCRIVTKCTVDVKTRVSRRSGALRAKGGWRRILFPPAELLLMRSQLRMFKQLAEQQFLQELADGRRLPEQSAAALAAPAVASG